MMYFQYCVWPNTEEEWRHILYIYTSSLKRHMEEHWSSSLHIGNLYLQHTEARQAESANVELILLQGEVARLSVTYLWLTFHHHRTCKRQYATYASLSHSKPPLHCCAVQLEAFTFCYYGSFVVTEIGSSLCAKLLSYRCVDILWLPHALTTFYLSLGTFLCSSKLIDFLYFNPKFIA